jgi:rare lipoprotein A
MMNLGGCAKKVTSTRTSPVRSKVSPTPRPQEPGTQKTYTVMGQTYTPVASAEDYREVGIASWYGKKFHGRLTASGEVYDMYQLTAAHRILPMQTMVEVTNRDNGKQVLVRINDRGPFVNNRILDLSYAAAKQLGVVGPGTARISIEAYGTNKKDLKGPFYIQVGSFTVADNAKKLRTKLIQRGYSQTRLHPIQLNNTTFWQVHAGVFPNLAQAENAKQDLVSENPACFILAD